ncbi:UNVERIFIED_CONTAM: hypothetical protein Sangu_2511500 [Sesamum angustifolium]|uniref:Uncharacterized protein n=1 Tax=Sesamum angustifolium TaxID=2727405 RepID=A0AAW2JM30_9LAMI
MHRSNSENLDRSAQANGRRRELRRSMTDDCRKIQDPAEDGDGWQLLVRGGRDEQRRIPTNSGGVHCSAAEVFERRRRIFSRGFVD